MSPQSILFAQIFVVFATIIIGVWAATQWVAAQLGYRANLGTHWFTLRGIPLY